MEGTIMERNKNDGCLEDFLGRYRALMDRVQVPDELHQKLMRRKGAKQTGNSTWQGLSVCRGVQIALLFLMLLEPYR